MNKVLLVDGYSMLNRAFYALPDLTNSAGQHTNAVLGFLNILFKMMDEEKPTHLVVAFDVKQPTFRHEMYREYKATRKKMPEELLEQVPVMKNILKAMRVSIVECPGFEADDIIGTLSRAFDQKGLEVCVLSGDRDLLQLATERILIKIPKTKGGQTVTESYYAKDVLERYEVTPIEFIDLKGLMGDSSDNIPGVPGIGEKTATKLIKEYGSIENAYANLEDIKPNKAKENLRDYYEQALMSKELATIKLDCEVKISKEEAEVKDLFNQEAYQIFKELELKSLLKRFDYDAQHTNFHLDVSVIDDFNEAEELFQVIKDKESVGLFPFVIHGELLGLSLAYENNKATFIACAGFIHKGYLQDKIKALLGGKVIIAVNGLKEKLDILNANEQTKNIVDTEIGAYLVNPMKNAYSYEDIARDFLDLILQGKEELLGKLEITSMLLRDKNVLAYLGYEAYVPFAAWKQVKKKLKEMNMLSLYEDIEMPTIYVLYQMEQEGIKADAKALKKYSHTLSVRICELEKMIYEAAGEEFNINSPKQLGEILFEKLNMPFGKKTKTGYSTNVDVLDKLKNDYKIVEDILEYRQLTKLKSTYADGLVNYIQDDGRIHGKFHQTITATGRISSTEPNLQNIPIRMPLGKMIRKAFIPKEGYVFVDADYSQIELRVLAHIAKDETLISAYQKHKDIHAITASEVFGVPIDKVDDLMRRNAKAVNFGIVYGISAFGLSQDLNISRKEASDYIEQYFKTYTDIKKFLDETVTYAKEKGYVTTWFGRIRPIPELSSGNFMQRSFGERVAMNSPIQGTAADIIKIAMIRVSNALGEHNLKSKLVLQVHDELLIEAHLDEVEVVTQILKKEMMGAANLSVPLEVAIHIRENWYEAGREVD